MPSSTDHLNKASVIKIILKTAKKSPKGLAFSMIKVKGELAVVLRDVPS